MAVFRVAKVGDFTTMSNHHLRNKKLSLKAVGLMSKILSLPNEWDYSLKGLACPVCKTNMSECTGVVPKPETPVEGDETEQPDDTEEPEKSSNMGRIIGVIAVVGIGGAAYYYFKFIRGKKQKDEDLDFFDDEGYEEEPYINEDNEPDIADDEETEAEDN